MNYRTLGRTQLQVSEIGFGAWAISGNSYGSTNDSDSIAALNIALDRGVNFIDTADIYGFGKSEELISQVLSQRRSPVIIATKGGWDFTQGPVRANYDPHYIQKAIESSLKRLKVETIDLYQLHNPPDTLLQEFDPVYEVLEKAKSAGKIRFLGISIYVPRQGIE